MAVAEKKYNLDIGPKFKEETLTETDWNPRQENIRDFFGLWDIKQTTICDYRSEPEKIKIHKLFNLYNR